MHLNVSMQMRMSQQMKLAPRMIQSMEILQMPLLELEERIEQELVENVVLEDESREPDTDSDGDEVTAELDADADLPDVAERELVVDSDQNNEADFERLLEMTNEWPEDNVVSAGRPSANRIDESGERYLDGMANITARTASLQEHLLEQFRYFDLEPARREFGEYLIQNLDANGRLQSTLGEIVQVYGREIPHEQAEEVLELIKKLDPPGVGARDLCECLLLQLEPDTPMRSVLVTLIESNFDDLGNNRLPAIQRKTGFSIETIKQAQGHLSHLDPFPGRQFDLQPVQAVKPDLNVTRGENGEWVVEMIDEYVPHLRLSRHYLTMLQNNPDPETVAYIKKKIESAKWLIESIEQRYGTVKRVAQAIVDHQHEYLDHGPEAIRPLKMQQIADVVGVHVTTVSRAVDGKWIQSPRELMPLRRFFGGGTKTAGGEDVAWGIIRLKLQELIDDEDKSRPLSDDAIVAALARHGFQLARRTVTKYRKRLEIPSSRQRREY